jgi:hypothetical protein
MLANAVYVRAGFEQDRHRYEELQRHIPTLQDKTSVILSLLRHRTFPIPSLSPQSAFSLYPQFDVQIKAASNFKLS